MKIGCVFATVIFLFSTCGRVRCTFPLFVRSYSNLAVPTMPTVKFMTFNSWIGGDHVKNGLRKIVNHVRRVQPDVVAFQEMSEDKLDRVLEDLANDSYWYKCNHTSMRHDIDPFIISKFPVIQNFEPSPHLGIVGCQLLVSAATPRVVVNVWNWHLHAYPYTPYVVCLEGGAQTVGDLMKWEYDAKDPMAKRRLNALHWLLNHGPFMALVNHTDDPLILAGDFNSPSHLDWTSQTRSQHCNWTFEWPVTKRLESLGFTDTYRSIHPDPTSDPGLTWSPIYTYSTDHSDKLEPKDRIDMIMYKGPHMKPTSSVVYHGNDVIWQHPKHGTNDWPSDHSAVITNFELYH